mgnify:CR=1 FL=1
MKRLILFYIGIVFSQNCVGQDLKIEFINKTGVDIDSVAIYDQYIGLFKKDSSFTIETSEIILQDHSIIGLPQGYIKGKKRYPKVIECLSGTKSRISSGHLIFEIVMIEDKNGYQLYFKRKS